MDNNVLIAKIYYYANTTLLFAFVLWITYIVFDKYTIESFEDRPNLEMCDQPLVAISATSILCWFLSYTFPKARYSLGAFNIPLLSLAIYFTIMTDECDADVYELTMLNLFSQLVVWTMLIIIIFIAVGEAYFKSGSKIFAVYMSEMYNL